MWKGEGKYLHPTDTVACNYLIRPLIHDCGTQVCICGRGWYISAAVPMSEVDVACQAALARGRYHPCNSPDLASVQQMCTIVSTSDTKAVIGAGISISGASEVGNCHVINYVELPLIVISFII